MVAFDEIFSGVTTFITIRQISAREWQKKTQQKVKNLSLFVDVMYKVVLKIKFNIYPFLLVRVIY